MGSIQQPSASTISKALVVDDSMSQRLLLSHMLEKLGYDVVSAKDGEEALAKFNEQRPDIIFMDIEMPKMNGIEATRAIRKVLDEDFIPIIFVTGGTSERYLEDCVAAGGDDFIKKPFNPTILSAKAQSLLRIKQLYNEQIVQKREIEAFKAEEDREHEIAAILNESIVMAGYMESPNVHHFLTPMSLFNGDILLCAYTPANKLNLLLGDFTGHGIIASVAAAPASEIFYGMTAKGFGIREITEEINTKLNRLLPAHMFLAATLACLDPETHNLSTITCGLPDHFLFNKETGEIKTLLSNNLPLGIVSSQELAPIEKHIEVTSQHRLFLFTDGIVEAENSSGEPFGFEGIKSCLGPTGTSSFDLVLESLQAHQGNQSQQDDITLVRLTCDFDPEKWNTQEPQDSRVEMEPSNWKLSSTMDYNTLKRLNPVPAMVNSLMEIQGLLPFRESIFLVTTELFANSLDHGLLGLDSSLKKSPDGFAQFFELRQQRLDQLSKGNIKLFFSHVPHKTGGELTIQVHDTGCGFDENQVLTDIKNNDGFSGRGIQLIRQICTSLEYSNDGRRATAVFTWSNE
ncbi:MAG: fused response regulator/phosphatase [Cycloclasticus sp.]